MRRNALIIGASGDIGSAIAITLGKSGYPLILHYNKNEEGIELIRKKVGSETILTELQADLSKDDEIKYLLKQIVFPVDIIIFASGKAQYGLFQNSAEESMDEMLSIHVKAPWMITKFLLPSMLRNHYGKIVFISSIWGDVGASNEVIYSSVKGAQNAFVKSLAKEVGPSGVNVNAVSPGFIDTKMNHHLLEDERQKIVTEIPMNRAGRPDEVANLIQFLVDDKSSYIQGEIIRLNGGW